MVKRIGLILVFIISFSLLISCGKAESQELISFFDENMTIDVYFIAGQSNAAGETYYKTVSKENRKAEHKTGYENIYFYGCSLYYGGFNGYMQLDSDFPFVKKDMGEMEGRIGPELGIAEYLSNYYNADTGREAVIVKYAVGGASLDGQFGSPWGNFCPPTLVAEGYEICGSDELNKDLYKNFMGVISDLMEILVQKGYKKINLCGLFWSQGESESGALERSAAYDFVLETFIKDFRADVYSITQNPQALELPVVIGEICPSFGGVDTIEIDGQIRSVNEGLNNVIDNQRKVASKMTNVYTIETNMYVLKAGVEGCLDSLHYGGNSALEIGRRAAEKLYNVNLNNNLEEQE